MSVIWHIFINMYTIHYIRKGRLWYCTNSAGPPHINVASISVNGRLNAWGGVRLIPLREGWSDQISQNPGIPKEGEGGPLPCPYHSLISFEFWNPFAKKESFWEPEISFIHLWPKFGWSWAFPQMSRDPAGQLISQWDGHRLPFHFLDQHFLAFTVEQISYNSPKMIRSCCSWSGKGRSAASLHPTEQSTLTWCPANSCQSVVFLPPSELFSWRSVLRMRVLRYSTGGVCLGV